jgi:hypothetical protein
MRLVFNAQVSVLRLGQFEFSQLAMLLGVALKLSLASKSPLSLSGRFLDMTADEIIELVEGILSSFPDRMSGNEVNPLVADKLRPFAARNRQALLEALRKYLSLRVPPSQRQPEHAIAEARLWMALDIAKELQLTELKPDIESLLDAVRHENALRPVHENEVSRYLQRLSA